MGKLQYYQDKIKEWEYCYCKMCKEVVYSCDLEATEKGIRCSRCKSYDLDAPGWVRCPQAFKASYVKCPRAGRGLKKLGINAECQDKCFFRIAKPEIQAEEAKV